MTVYLASPLGFADSTKAFMAELEKMIGDQGLEVFNPWRNPLGGELATVQSRSGQKRRVQTLRVLNRRVAGSNEEAIRRCDSIIAVLDGVDVDSGTASEIGFGYGLGKIIVGLRTDSRLAGDNEATTVNLQLQYWIEASGGRVVKCLSALEAFVSERRALFSDAGQLRGSVVAATHNPPEHQRLRRHIL